MIEAGARRFVKRTDHDRFVGCHPISTHDRRPCVWRGCSRCLRIGARGRTSAGNSRARTALARRRDARGRAAGRVASRGVVGRNERGPPTDIAAATSRPSLSRSLHHHQSSRFGFRRSNSRVGYHGGPRAVGPSDLGGARSRVGNRSRARGSTPWVSQADATAMEAGTRECSRSGRTCRCASTAGGHRAALEENRSIAHAVAAINCCGGCGRTAFGAGDPCLARSDTDDTSTSKSSSATHRCHRCNW